jgi:hypothetical protein
VLNKPLAYFITATTYGTWLHGDERKSVMVKDGFARRIESNDPFHQYQKNRLKYPPVSFNAQQRQIVLDTLLQHCQLKAWRLYAAHVRTTHIHLVVQSDQTAEKVTSDLKAWCTRRLREADCQMPKVWTRQGSTVYVFTWAKLIEKIRYVVQEQGEPMSVYVDEDFSG